MSASGTKRTFALELAGGQAVGDALEDVLLRAGIAEQLVDAQRRQDAECRCEQDLKISSLGEEDEIVLRQFGIRLQMCHLDGISGIPDIAVVRQHACGLIVDKRFLTRRGA